MVLPLSVFYCDIGGQDIVVDDENRLMVLDVLNRLSRNNGKKQ